LLIKPNGTIELVLEADLFVLDLMLSSYEFRSYCNSLYVLYSKVVLFTYYCNSLLSLLNAAAFMYGGEVFRVVFLRFSKLVLF